MNRQIKWKEKARLCELLDKKDALPKDKLCSNNRNAVAKPHLNELTVDHINNSSPNVRFYSNTMNVVRNSNIHRINDYKCTTLVTNVVVVPLLDNHRFPY